jgi:hypothetical protein
MISLRSSVLQGEEINLEMRRYATSDDFCKSGINSRTSREFVKPIKEQPSDEKQCQHGPRQFSEANIVEIGTGLHEETIREDLQHDKKEEYRMKWGSHSILSAQNYPGREETEAKLHEHSCSSALPSQSIISIPFSNDKAFG